MRRETFADIWGSVWHNHVLVALGGPKDHESRADEAHGQRDGCGGVFPRSERVSDRFPSRR